MRAAAAVCSLLAVLFSGCSSVRPPVLELERERPPSPPREFRGVWVATVGNIDWPSAPGLPVERQQAEMRAILDRARGLNLNAVVLQVRPQCDAFYPSPHEPWSYFLTGREGSPPAPLYDPLEMWIREAHARCLELHAWFNPYRAHCPGGGPIGAESIASKHPELVRALKGGYRWLDPAHAGTQEHSLAVILDVVRRYDIDGVHLDDYFYPYPAYNKGEDFPDDETWEAYRRGGGTRSRADWRRDNVSAFVERLYAEIKAAKPHVKLGISPFGIWRPGYPSSIKGLDQYEVLYADARRWLNEGWVDYFSPQLYWGTDRMAQSFPVLLGWWARENTRGRNLWPGLSASSATDPERVREHVNQIMITRGFLPGAPGAVHFSMKALMKNAAGINEALLKGPYAGPALVPPSPWLDADPPASVRVERVRAGGRTAIAWSRAEDDDIFCWVLYLKERGRWRFELLEASARCYPRDPTADVAGESPMAGITHAAVSAVDRAGSESVATIVDLRDGR